MRVIRQRRRGPWPGDRAQAIELHAGRVWAENAEPGLRVYVNLPAADSTPDSARNLKIRPMWLARELVARDILFARARPFADGCGSVC